LKDARVILALLYQHVQKEANLRDLVPRPLLARQVVAGSSEFAVTDVRTLEGGGVGANGLVVRRCYSGYVAVHYAHDTNPGDLTPDEARLNAALEGFRLIPAVQVPAVYSFGGFATGFRLNELPRDVQQPEVLTMSTDWDLTLDLETGVHL